jgi:hypothetical protein
MIATVGFTIVLLLMTFSITYFMVDYYKVTLDNTVETTVTNISDNIEHTIELSSGLATQSGLPAPDPTSNPSCSAGDSGTPPNCTSPGYICAGNVEFAYFIGSEVPYALYELPNSSGICVPDPEFNPITMPNWSSGRSLLGDNYRLLLFNISNDAGTPEYEINIKIAYTSGGVNGAGDDLLCSASIPGYTAGSCALNSPNLTLTDYIQSDYTQSDIECKSQVGQQFCDVAALQSNVGSYVN